MDDIMARAANAGVGHMVTICTRITKFDAILAIAEQFENVFCTVGIHPHNAGDEPEVTPQRLIELA